MFDPDHSRARIEGYLGSILGCQVMYLKAERLKQSTRAAPWKIVAEVEGVEKSFVLQTDPDTIEHEYQVLKAMECTPVPTPKAYALDLTAEGIGTPCSFCEFIEGEPLLEPVISGESWAEDLYIDAVFKLLSVTEEDLGELAGQLGCETAEDVLEDAHAYLQAQDLPLAEQAYAKLKESLPELPAVRFSNGDLWLENFLVKDGQLTGVIDFANAGFSDPLFEFLLSFFVSPQIQGRGLEERFCRKLGLDPAILHWYHGLEFFDTWRWVLKTGEGFVHHTAESLENNLRRWLEKMA